MKGGHDDNGPLQKAPVRFAQLNRKWQKRYKKPDVSMELQFAGDNIIHTIPYMITSWAANNNWPVYSPRYSYRNNRKLLILTNIPGLAKSTADVLFNIIGNIGDMQIRQINEIQFVTKQSQIINADIIIGDCVTCTNLLPNLKNDPRKNKKWSFFDITDVIFIMRGYPDNDKNDTDFGEFIKKMRKKKEKRPEGQTIHNWCIVQKQTRLNTRYYPDHTQEIDCKTTSYNYIKAPSAIYKYIFSSGVVDNYNYFGKL